MRKKVRSSYRWTATKLVAMCTVAMCTTWSMHARRTQLSSGTLGRRDDVKLASLESLVLEEL